MFFKFCVESSGPKMSGFICRFCGIKITVCRYLWGLEESG